MHKCPAGSESQGPGTTGVRAGPRRQGGTHRGTGWGGLGAPVDVGAPLPLAVLQTRHRARALLLLELGQDG